MLVCRRRPSRRKKSRNSEKKTSSTFFSIDRPSSPFPGSATGRRRARSMRSPRSPHSVHGLPTCIWTRDAGVIAIVRAKFVILGALSPGQKWRLYFRGFPPGFLSFFTPTRTILREFWAFRRRGSAARHLMIFLLLFPFPPFFSLFSPSLLLPQPQRVKNCRDRHLFTRCGWDKRL